MAASQEKQMSFPMIQKQQQILLCIIMNPQPVAELGALT